MTFDHDARHASSPPAPDDGAAPTLSTEPVLVRWPIERARREQLALAGRPRILLLGPDTPPPDLWDELEDWIREPIDAPDLLARVATVRIRATRLARRPRFDDDGLLWSDDRWVSLVGAQFAVARLLVDSFGEVVPSAAIAACLDEGGWRSADGAQRVVLARLRQRLAGMGLDVRQVRGRGPMLELAEDRSPSDSVAKPTGISDDTQSRSSTGRGAREMIT